MNFSSILMLSILLIYVVDLNNIQILNKCKPFGCIRAKFNVENLIQEHSRYLNDFSKHF